MQKSKVILLNSLSGAGAVVLNTLLQFINRTIFIHVLSAKLLGFSGLFTSVLGVLSLADLGIGTAISFLLYKPLANGDNKVVAQLMTLYKKIYRVLGVVVLLLGVVIFPFINLQITGTNAEIQEVQLVYFAYLLNSVVAYYFAYLRVLFDADQKSYKNQLNYMVFNSLSSISQLIILLRFRNFLLYALVAVLFTMLSNISISFLVKKEYRHILTMKIDKGLDRTIWRQIIKLTIGNFSNKIGTIVVYSTDNILISTFVGVVQVGVYSNYALITNTLQNVIQRLFAGNTATIAQIKAKTLDEQKNTLFNLTASNSVLALIISGIYYIVVDLFIRFWIGSKFALTDIVTFVIALNLSSDIFRRTALTFIDAYGLAWEQRWK